MFKPNLAGKFDPLCVRFPAMVSPKLDGIRCLAMNGVAMSRSMKPIPNRFVQNYFATHADVLNGVDGELIVGDATDKAVYRNTNSGVMSSDGTPSFTFFAFDRWDMPPTAPFKTRFSCIDRGLPHGTRRLKHERITDSYLIDLWEHSFLEQGYEGMMLRSENGLYKQGRSTTAEGGLLKIKRFLDAEAEIIGFEEKMHNGNEAKLDELGHTKRSSHQVNKTGMDTLGALVCKGLTAFPGIQFNVGTGFDDVQRASVWRQREQLLGKTIKFKYFDVGVKDAPRHPVFLGLRELGT